MEDVDHVAELRYIQDTEDSALVSDSKLSNSQSDGIHWLSIVWIPTQLHHFELMPHSPSGRFGKAPKSFKRISAKLNGLQFPHVILNLYNFLYRLVNGFLAPSSNST